MTPLVAAQGAKIALHIRDVVWRESSAREFKGGEVDRFGLGQAPCVEMQPPDQSQDALLLFRECAFPRQAIPDCTGHRFGLSHASSDQITVGELIQCLELEQWQVCLDRALDGPEGSLDRCLEVVQASESEIAFKTDSRPKRLGVRANDSREQWVE